MNLTNQALEKVIAEREKQDAKWGVQRHDNGKWLQILMEEVGEVSQAQLQNQPIQHQIEEMTQVVAVGLAWLEQLIEYEQVQRGVFKYPRIEEDE